MNALAVLAKMVARVRTLGVAICAVVRLVIMDQLVEHVSTIHWHAGKYEHQFWKSHMQNMFR